MNPKYIRALQRPDLSEWVIHLTKQWTIPPATTLSPFDVLKRIVVEQRLDASTQEHVTSKDPAGAVCLYDVPPSCWYSLINTNPNMRSGYGVIINKRSLWAKGGRPVIYTDPCATSVWPEGQRYRLVFTNLLRFPDPDDFMHEREWRFRGNLPLAPVAGEGTWWWLCVPTVEDAKECFSMFVNDFMVYVLEQGRLVGRAEVMNSGPLMPSVAV